MTGRSLAAAPPVRRRAPQRLRSRVRMDSGRRDLRPCRSRSPVPRSGSFANACPANARVLRASGSFGESRTPRKLCDAFPLTSSQPESLTIAFDGPCDPGNPCGRGLPGSFGVVEPKLVALGRLDAKQVIPGGCRLRLASRIASLRPQAWTRAGAAAGSQAPSASNERRSGSSTLINQFLTRVVNHRFRWSMRPWEARRPRPSRPGGPVGAAGFRSEGGLENGCGEAGEPFSPAESSGSLALAPPS